MLPDGTIAVWLRAESTIGADEYVGHAYYEVRPTDPEYESEINHLGGLKPGEEKSYPAWPDTDSEMSPPSK
jgi:hypothetical protein